MVDNMDKTIEYQIKDMQNPKDKISITIKITTIGYPVDETLEFEHEGEWYTDITQVNRNYEDNQLQQEWEAFQSRLLPFLNDGNLRIILDIMEENDTYYSDKYKLQVDVTSAHIQI